MLCHQVLLQSGPGWILLQNPKAGIICGLFASMLSKSGYGFLLRQHQGSIYSIDVLSFTSPRDVVRPLPLLLASLTVPQDTSIVGVDIQYEGFVNLDKSTFRLHLVNSRRCSFVC